MVAWTSKKIPCFILYTDKRGPTCKCSVHIANFISLATGQSKDDSRRGGGIFFWNTDWINLISCKVCYLQRRCKNRHRSTFKSVQRTLVDRFNLSRHNEKTWQLRCFTTSTTGPTHSGKKETMFGCSYLPHFDLLTYISVWFSSVVIDFLIATDQNCCWFYSGEGSGQLWNFTLHVRQFCALCILHIGRWLCGYNFAAFFNDTPWLDNCSDTRQLESISRTR